MKIEVTVNIGNFQNIKVLSSEYDNPEHCKDEIKAYLLSIKEPACDDFVKRYFK